VPRIHRSGNWRNATRLKPNNIQKQEYFSGSPAENVQVPVLPEEVSWHQKACSVKFVLLKLINFGSKQENPELMKNLTLEKIDSYEGSVHILIDASKTIDNKTSAAFCVPEFT